MYRCGDCGKVIGPKVQGKVRVIQKRQVEYVDENDVVAAKGTEIVKEIRVGPCCVNEGRDLDRAPLQGRRQLARSAMKPAAAGIEEGMILGERKSQWK